MPTHRSAQDPYAAAHAEACDDEQDAGIRAGSFHLEFPETEDGERGATEPLDWPGATT